MRPPLRFVLTLIVSCSISSSQAATIYVDDNAPNDPGPGDPLISDPNENGSLAHPYDGIQEAVDAAVHRDEIVLADGLYVGSSNRNINFGRKALTVRSASGNPDACVIDCEKSGRGFILQNIGCESSRISGLSITRARKAGGSAIRVIHSSLILDNCILLANDDASGSGRGGALHLSHSTAAIKNCVFKKNLGAQTWYDGGAILSLDSSLDIENCIFIENTSANYGGSAIGHFGGPLRVGHSTFYNNDLTDGDFTFVISSEDATITNCIIWEKPEPPIPYPDILYGDVDITYSCIPYGSLFSWFGTGCIDVDPQFLNPQTFRLSPSSPCIDAGTNTPPGGLANLDFDGNPRLLDGDLDQIVITDMGAYEYDPNAPIVVIDKYKFTFEVDSWPSSPPAQVLTAQNIGSGSLDWTITNIPSWLTVSPSSGTLTDETIIISLEVDTSTLLNDTYHAVLLLNEPARPTSSTKISVRVNVTGDLVVPGQYPTIQAAVDAASDHDVISLTPGVYHGSGNNNVDFLGKAITIRSADRNANGCVIDCQNTGPGFIFANAEGPDSILEGLSIINGSSNLGGAIHCIDSSPTIRECVLANNQASDNGGAVYLLNSNPSFINCTLLNNSATNIGGAIYNEDGGDFAMTNCTLAGNQATFCGGVYNINSDATITNSILWSNVNGEIITSGTSTVSATYSCVQNGTGQPWFGIGSIDVDPQFTSLSDVYLAPTSPCIDAGTNTPPSGLPPYDLHGNPRPMDGNDDGSQIADMGAYEIYEWASLDYLDCIECTTGPDVTTPPVGCDQNTYRLADIDSDRDVDMHDQMIIQQIIPLTSLN